jgi:hypothetical protein
MSRQTTPTVVRAGAADAADHAEVLPSLRRLSPLPPSRLRGGRRPLNPADIDVFAAIVGRSPTAEERERALEPPAETRTEAAESSDAARPPTVALVVAGRTWSPALLCTHLRALVNQSGHAYRAYGPQFTGWVRRVSNEAIRRLDPAPLRRRLAKVSFLRDASDPTRG